MTETIVTLAASHCDRIGLPEGFSLLEPEGFARLFDASEVWLGPRALLEVDERYRQLVSYVLFRHRDTVLVYRRTPKGGESRLHGLLSVGIGGHVNVSDVVSHDGAVDLEGTLSRACRREIAEEVECASIEALHTMGVILESGNAVSRVHLGLVVECRLAAPEVRVLDPGLVDARFVPVHELAAISTQMETWSSSLVGYLVANPARSIAHS